MEMRRSVLLAYATVAACAMFVSSTAHAISICLDPGHGGSDPGAIGCDLKEAEVVLKSSKMLKSMLESAGHTVYMTRTSNVDVGVGARASYANGKGVATFASIHNNSFSTPSATGIETFCYINNLSKKSGTQAKNIQNNMIATWPLANRGAKEANYAVVRETNMPATLSELAFISNCSKDAKYLANDAELKRAMVAHCKAIVAQWGGNAAKCSEGGGGGGGGETTSKGTIKAGTFNTTIANDKWLGGVKYSVGGQTQTSAGSYSMMSFSLAPGKYSATASKDGFNTATKECQPVTAGQVAWCSIALTPKPAEIKPGTAVGHVDNAATGAHIANAKVDIKNGATATYNGKDKWSFSVNPGTYQIIATADGYDDNEKSCTVVSQKESDCTITLTPKKGVITGAVTDGAQNVAAKVSLNDSNVDYDASTPFTFTVEAGTYTINAIAEGYKPGSASCSVNPGQTATCNITVEREQVAVERGTLMGLVKDANSGENVKSDVTTNDQTVHFTGTEYYRFYLEPGEYTVTATATGYEKGESKCTVKSGESVHCDISITPLGGAFAGTLLDAVTKQPIDSAKKPIIKIGESTVEVDDKGAWKSTQAAGEYDVSASAEGYRTTAVSCTVEPGNQESPCEILLVPNDTVTGALVGYVYDSRSETMRIPATVSIEGYSPAKYPGKGTWRMTNLPAGFYNVRATADGYYEATRECQVMPSDDDKEYSPCNIGLVAKSTGGAVVEAEYDTPTTKVQVYSDSCSATPATNNPHSSMAWAFGIVALVGLGIRRRLS